MWQRAGHSQANEHTRIGSPLVMRDARGGMKKTEEFGTKVLRRPFMWEDHSDKNKICLKSSGRIQVMCQFRSSFVYELSFPTAVKAHNGSNDGTS